MIFLRKIDFIKKHRVFKKEDSVEFLSPITLLVGDQGSGKSTLLNLIQGNKKDICTFHADKCRFRFFDTEKHNPRLSHAPMNQSQNSFLFRMTSHTKSHGQVINHVLSHINECKNLLFLIDEPESGLSIRSQYELISLIQNKVKDNLQFIIATHSMIFMNEIENVYSLEHRKHMSSSEFIESQRI